MVRTVTSWMTVEKTPDGDGLQGARRVAEPARQARGLVLELLRDVVLVVVLAQRVVRADVVDVARDVVRERLHLVDDRRHHDEADQEDREEERRGRRRGSTAGRGSFIRDGAVDRRAERDREEDGDQQQPDDRADEVEHVQQDAEGDQREEDADDRPRAELGLSGHGRRQRIRWARRGASWLRLSPSIGGRLGGAAAACPVMSHGLLIVGGGLAAQRCCETLRALGHDGPITIAGAEASEPYDRPPLSKEGISAGACRPALPAARVVRGPRRSSCASARPRCACDAGRADGRAGRRRAPALRRPADRDGQRAR